MPEYEPTVLDQVLALEVKRDLHTQREEHAEALAVEKRQFDLIFKAVGLEPE